MTTHSFIQRTAEQFGGTPRGRGFDGTTLLPSIDLGGYGFEATEEGTDRNAGGIVAYWGWRFYGDSRRQYEQRVTDLFNALTRPVVEKELLTIDRAKALIGRTVRLSYCDVNEGEYTIIIDAMVDEPSRGMLGQGPTCKRLHFREVMEDGREEPGTWLYEWQGIFRRGSGAERLFVEEVVRKAVFCSHCGREYDDLSPEEKMQMEQNLGCPSDDCPGRENTTATTGL